MTDAFVIADVFRRPVQRRAVRSATSVCAAILFVASAAAWYQARSESLDRTSFRAPGELVDVGGRRLHLYCAGTGTPTVVLESGLGETATYWTWIWAAIARETRVCAYDRAGRGWSDPSPTPQDGVAVATDLHRLLERRRIEGPILLVGHSSGAAYARVFASRYPDRVAGMVLLDGQPAAAFERLPAFPGFYRVFQGVSRVLPALARLGIGRIVAHFTAAGLPVWARDGEKAIRSSVQYYRSLRDEVAMLPVTLEQSRVLHSLGARPLIVVTATRDALAGWLPLQDEMTQLSTNAVHRTRPATHGAIVEDRDASRVSIGAIRDVLDAVRRGTSLRP